MARESHFVVRRISVLLLSVVILGIGSGLQGTLLAVRAGLEGMAEESIGMLMSGFFLGYLVSSILSPRLVEAVGHIRTFAALASIASAVTLTYVLWISPISWTCLRIMHGACYAGMALVVESWLNSCTDREHRGKVLSIYGSAGLAAWSAGQPLLITADPLGFELFCLISIFLSLALVPITVTPVTIPGAVAAARMKLQQLYQISPLGVIGVFIAGVCVNAFVGMGPRFAQAIGLDRAAISTFMSISMIGALAMQWPLGWLSDRIDRRWVILLAAFGAVLVSVALIFNSDKSFPILLALSCCFGGLCVPLYSLCVAHTNDHIRKEGVVAATSTLLLIYGAGSIMGPLAASLVMKQIGPAGLFVYIAVLEFLFVGFILYRISQRSVILQELKQKLVHLPCTTHVILNLDERRRESPPLQDRSKADLVSYAD